MNPKVLTVGSAYFSMNLEIPAVPPSGGSTKIKKYIRYPDGSGVNTAIALQKLDTNCILVTSVGGDSGGKTVYNFLSSYLNNMLTVHVEKGESVGTIFNLDDVDGGRRRLVFEGANNFLTTDMVEDAFSSCPDAVIVNGDGSVKCAALLRYAGGYGGGLSEGLHFPCRKGQIQVFHHPA